MDEPPPPSYDLASTIPQTTPQNGGIGQLIDLGSDITTPPTSSDPQGDRADDIVAQLAQLGVTPGAGGGADGQTQGGGAKDDFDMFAQSRTAYGTEQQGCVELVGVARECVDCV